MVLLAACGKSADPACVGNVAVVGNTAISTAQYRLLLRYTLAFYERADRTSRYYHRNICGDPSLHADCVSLRKRLRQRMIDQQIVGDYAAQHNLLPTGADWNRALAREHQLVQNAGGEQAFERFLAKLRTSQARFRFIESEQIETDKVSRAIGYRRFANWLKQREAAARTTLCPLTGA